jgi:thiamine pyrophosphate-dependent acetolactate synthase large subunit-like protein
MTATDATVGLDRRRFVADLMARFPENTLVVTGLGSPSYDVFAAGDRPGNFYLWGAMGAAGPLALGLALAQPERPVVAITGDGEHLMGIGALGTIGALLPPNLTLVVLDNGHFGETGMQRSHTGHGLDIAAVASACGFAKAATLTDLEQVNEARKSFGAIGAGPQLFVIKVRAENLPRSLPPRDAVHLKNRFRAQLGLRPT